MDIKLTAHKLAQQCYNEDEDCPMTCVSNEYCPFVDELDCTDITEQHWEEILNKIKEHYDSLVSCP